MKLVAFSLKIKKSTRMSVSLYKYVCIIILSVTVFGVFIVTLILLNNCEKVCESRYI